MKAFIRNIIQESASVRRIVLEFPELEQFAFQAGQFVVITFEELPDGNNERSYSISSAPTQNNQIEICVVLNPEGAGTRVLWDKIPGDKLEVSEAKGSFILPDEIQTEIAFICTGTGVAPFRSMIIDLLNNKNFKLPVYLIFGNRYSTDILYRKEFEKMQGEHPHFHFIPVLSREENWSGEKGHVHAAYEKLFSNGRDARFFVCGWQAMCSETRNRLKALGYNRRQYFFEDYG